MTTRSDGHAEIDAEWNTEFRRRIDDIESGRVELLSREQSEARV